MSEIKNVHRDNGNLTAAVFRDVVADELAVKTN